MYVAPRRIPRTPRVGLIAMIPELVEELKNEVGASVVFVVHTGAGDQIKYDAMVSSIAPSAAGPRAPFVLLSDASGVDVLKFLAQGVNAVIPRHSPVVRILRAVDAVLEGDVVLSRPVIDQLSGILPTEELSEVQLLPLEQRWLGLLADGRPISRIAEETGWSERHLRRRLRSVYVRLGAENRDQAVRAAAKLGLT